MSTINPQKLIFLRKEANLTAEALAVQANVGRATITRIENGTAGATRAETARRLANTLKCQIADLFTPPDAEQSQTLFNDRVPLGMNRPGIAGGQLHQIMLPWACRPAWRSSALRPRQAGYCRWARAGVGC